ncbi:hypothetical protein [Micromonospora endolithica]|uniref:RNA polymerase sigma-70 region 2 domain-containing protein n=1 Tax=Micromonospora endolithica TaxID=230091 RepID=A0A3A9YZG6_9ACTN|nr:hypothetical protein [Micromonospora endolithica]RKN41084.1 hypothetical protein D7223_25415 [Micromonospora endolithica]TWJ24309.1 RNA polymerase ECF family sigma subunit [Micromonospora endolithica]
MPVPPVYVVPGPESVDDLVKRIADRDRAAFGRLYRRLVRAVFVQVRDSVGSPSVAVAVTRAVFVEVWQLAPRHAADQVGGLAWVTAIAARRAEERLRGIDGRPPPLATSSPATGYDAFLGRELTAALGEPAALFGTSVPPGTG